MDEESVIVKEPIKTKAEEPIKTKAEEPIKTKAEEPTKRKKTPEESQRGRLLIMISLIFALGGFVLFQIVFFIKEEATLTFAYDLLKVWMGALIGLVSSVGTYYFAGE